MNNYSSILYRSNWIHWNVVVCCLRNMQEFWLECQSLNYTVNVVISRLISDHKGSQTVASPAVSLGG